MRRFWARSLLIMGLIGLGCIARARAQHVSPAQPFFVPVSSLVPDSLPAPVAPPSARRNRVRADSMLSWTGDLVGTLRASQAAYRNWTGGGLSTLAMTLDVQGRLVGATTHWKQRYDLRLTLGVIQQDTFAVRKASDRVRLKGVLKYRGAGFFETFNPTLALDLRTQLIAGYNYEKDPLGLERTPPVEVSDFFAPATLTQTIGLTYDPGTWYTQRLSIGTKEVIVIERRLRPLYGLAPGTAVHVEAGVESTTRIRYRFSERVYFESTLGLFAAFNKDLPDLIWENLLQLQFNGWLSVDLEMIALYDGEISQALQIKEVLAIGASIELI